MTCPRCGRAVPDPLGIRVTPRTLCRVCYAEDQGDIDMAIAETAWQDGHRLGYARGQRDASSDPSAIISLDLVEKAITLTHPDRQPSERFALANTVTANLIELRESLKRLPERAA